MYMYMVNFCFFVYVVKVLRIVFEFKRCFKWYQII